MQSMVKFDSNTTFVKVKYYASTDWQQVNFNSNTTFVKVKSMLKKDYTSSKWNSNTTFVKVKYSDHSLFDGYQTIFKYNIC